jgi:hypothetical protein
MVHVSNTIFVSVAIHHTMPNGTDAPGLCPIEGVNQACEALAAASETNHTSPNLSDTSPMHLRSKRASSFSWRKRRTSADEGVDKGGIINNRRIGSSFDSCRDSFLDLRGRLSMHDTASSDKDGESTGERQGYHYSMRSKASPSDTEYLYPSLMHTPAGSIVGTRSRKSG